MLLPYPTLQKFIKKNFGAQHQKNTYTEKIKNHSTPTSNKYTQKRDKKEKKVVALSQTLSWIFQVVCRNYAKENYSNWTEEKKIEKMPRKEIIESSGKEKGAGKLKEKIITKNILILGSQETYGNEKQ